MDFAKYLVSHSVAGAAIGLFWGVFMLATNTASLGSLVSQSSSPAESILIFLAGSAVIFQPFAIAAAIGALATDRRA